VPRTNTPIRPLWLRLAIGLVICALVVAAWHWIPSSAFSADRFASWFAPHRDAWYALPAVVLAFIALGLLMVPVVVLIAATGLAFGPVLGPIYAMVGCLASAATGFGLGRWLGRGRVERVVGERTKRLMQTVSRNGVLAVFLIRKLPVAPFIIVNIVIGASAVRFRDFILGTALAMGVFVIAIAGFGSELIDVLRHPSLNKLLAAAAFVVIPLTVAWQLNRVFRRTRIA
jgi:uncharacterized membrane protein YdjX (TVP38/TMEM64 family)